MNDDVPDALKQRLDAYEEKARALFDAYHLGTPEALEKHYSFTWHRRALPVMRNYIELDLGKRPDSPGELVDLTMDDARYLIAMDHDYASWDELVKSVKSWPARSLMTAGPMSIRREPDEESQILITSRNWNEVLDVLAEHPGAVLDARGQMTDDMLKDVSRITGVTALQLGNSKTITDSGLRHLAGMPNLRNLNLSQTGVTDRGLEVLATLPRLEMLSLVFTPVTDAGMVHLQKCHQLRRLNLMWTNTGDGAIRALAGKEHFTHLVSGNHVTNDGITALHDLPQLAKPQASEVKTESSESKPNQVELRGTFNDEGLERMRGLDGLAALSVNDAPISARGMRPLISLANLEWLSVDPKDDWMQYIAAMPVLRHLGAQDTTAGDDGFIALSESKSIEGIWGRRCHNLRTRGFVALSRMPRLRSLSVSCLNVDDSGVAALPDFPALRELMPMDVPDAGYRHIGKCLELEVLTLMYCRDTTDAATEHITGLKKLRRYFNSYTTITDRTPRLLSTMDSLETVIFDACNNLTNDGIASLARLPRLKEVRVSGRSVTRDVAASFPARVTVRYSP